MMTSACTSGKAAKVPCYMFIVYGVFAMSAVSIWHLVADGEFSALLTIAGVVQCLAVALLALQMVSTDSAAGISAQALKLDALALCCKLSSTLWLNGYLPNDASGDHVSQIVDVMSLGMIVWMLHRILVVKRHTYQEEDDSMPVAPIASIALFLAVIFHGNMNARPLFDVLWMAGLFMNTVAGMPQLWFITRTGGSIDALTSHHIACMAFAHVLSGVFMWHAADDISCDPWIGHISHASMAILAAHFLHMLLVGDFLYHYVTTIISKGLNCRMDIMEECGV